VTASLQQLSRTDAQIEAMSAEEVLSWAYEEFGESLCISCSWQKQSSVLVHMISELDLDVDIVELDTHLFFKETYETRERLVERYGLVPDSGGPGRHRGGLAIERAWRCLTPDTSLIVRSDRAARPPYGLAGGLPGAPSANVLVRPDGSEETLPPMFSTTIGEGDVYVHRIAGGGGFGDPLERDPALVGRDVANGKVSAASAAADYVVVVGTDGILDEDATERLRAERRQGRT